MRINTIGTAYAAITRSSAMSYVICAPDDTVTAISIFNDYAGAEESNSRGLAWRCRLAADRG
jgi:hypothetical protein